MVDSLDLQTDRALFTDPVTGNVRGVYLYNDLLNFVNGALTVLMKLCGLDQDTLANKPASAIEGLFYLTTDTLELFLDNGTSLIKVGCNLESGCRAYLGSGDQTIPTGVNTVVEFDSVDYDYGSEFDTTEANAFYATDDGVYQYHAQVCFDDTLGDGDFARIRLTKNGTQVAQGMTIYTGGAGVVTVVMSGLLEIDAGDYLKVEIYHNFGANRDIDSQSWMTSFSVHRVA